MIGKIATFCKNLLDWFKSDRCFVSNFIKAFPFANDLMLLTLLILSIFIISIYMIISSQTGINTGFSLLVIILLSSAFASGIFYTIKTNLDESAATKVKDNEETKINIKKSFAVFYSGIGEHYLTFVFAFVIFFTLASLVILGTIFFVNKFLFPIASVGENLADFFAILAYPSQTDGILQNLDEAQKVNLRMWCRSFLVTTQTFTFLIMLWIPEMLYSKKNAFVSLFRAIKKVLSDFPNTLCIYLSIMFLNYIIALLFVLFGGISFINFILNIASLYILIFNFYAIFIYYRNKYINEWVA